MQAHAIAALVKFINLRLWGSNLDSMMAKLEAILIAKGKGEFIYYKTFSPDYDRWHVYRIGEARNKVGAGAGGDNDHGN